MKKVIARLAHSLWQAAAATVLVALLAAPIWRRHELAAKEGQRPPVELANGQDARALVLQSPSYGRTMDAAQRLHEARQRLLAAAGQPDGDVQRAADSYRVQLQQLRGEVKRLIDRAGVALGLEIVRSLDVSGDVPWKSLVPEEIAAAVRELPWDDEFE